MDTLQITTEDWDLLQKNKPITDKWIAGLRSGKWIQTIGAMTSVDVPNSACCLMVVEAECNNKTVNDYIRIPNNELDVPTAAGLPSEEENPLQLQLHGLGFKYPQSLTAVFKCNSGIERLRKFHNTSLAPSQWNDTLQLTFEEIATLLETGSLTKDFSV
jgi:hypothetical protein